MQLCPFCRPIAGTANIKTDQTNHKNPRKIKIQQNKEFKKINAKSENIKHSNIKDV